MHFASDLASNFQRLNVEEWVKFHIHMLLTCRIYLNHDSDCDRFAMSISGSVIFLGEVSF